MPEEVKDVFGYGLHLAQIGARSPNSKPLKGFPGASVVELIENHDGETYRAVYTTRIKDAVYVLHCFQKKSRKGRVTSKFVIETIRKRLKEAEKHGSAT